MASTKLSDAEGADTPAKELLQAQSCVFNDVLALAGSMAIKCAVELNIPDAIHAHGQPITLTELVAKLAIPPSNSPALSRLMRLLVHKGYFAHQKECNTYSLTPLSKILVKDSPTSLSSWLLGIIDTSMLAPWGFLSAFFRHDHQKEGFISTCTMAFGRSIWDLARENPEMNTLINETMAGDARLVMRAMVIECEEAFKGLRSLVDVGGGNGTAARVIAEAFPRVKCGVYDLPHVIDIVSKSPLVEAISGNMFKHIPPADAVFMKMVLHDWSDEDCVKILKLCKEAIPPIGGKVMIVDIVMEADSQDYTTTETKLYWDVTMLSATEGREREEHEWKKLFLDAGFSEYKITPLGVRSLIEVFP